MIPHMSVGEIMFPKVQASKSITELWAQSVWPTRKGPISYNATTESRGDHGFSKAQDL
jgi:hypothetical protein